MYSEQDVRSIERKIRSIQLLVWIPAAILLAGVVWSFILRIKWLTILLSALCGCWIIFTWENLYVPRRAYRSHILNALHNASKEFEGRYLRTETTPVERENVMFYAFYLNVGDKNDPEDDRLFYYDALLPLPDWHSGDRLRVRSYDKFVASYEVIARQEPVPPAAGGNV